MYNDEMIYFHINNGGLVYRLSLEDNKYSYLASSEIEQEVNESKVANLFLSHTHFGVDSSYMIPLMDQKTIDLLINKLNEVKQYLPKDFDNRANICEENNV